MPTKAAAPRSLVQAWPSSRGWISGYRLKRLNASSRHTPEGRLTDDRVYRFRSLLLGACVAMALPADAREFRSADIHPTDYPTVEAVRYMGKLLSEQTGGKIGVKVYPNGALGTEKDTIEQLKIGGLDMMRINVAPLNNVVPETIVPALPFLFRSDRAHARRARRADRRRDPGRDGSAGHGRPRLLRQRRRARCTPRPSRSRAWPTSRA